MSIEQKLNEEDLSSNKRREYTFSENQELILQRKTTFFFCYFNSQCPLINEM